MLNLPVKTQQITGPILITVICILLWLIEPLSFEYLAFNRNDIADYYWWQFITANFIHTNTNHLLLNLSGLILLWAVQGQYYNFQRYVLEIVLFSLWVTIGIYIFSPSLIWYVGLSGVLHGLFVYGAYKDIHSKVAFGWVLFLGVWLKIGYEQIFGAEQMISDLIAANVAIDAHLYGAIGGFGLVMFDLIKAKKSPQ